MNKKLKAFIYCVIFIFCNRSNSLYSQNIDSLKSELKKNIEDTTRCKILSLLTEISGDDEWPDFNDELLKLSELRLKNIKPGDKGYKIFKLCYANAIVNKGVLLEEYGEYQKAMEYYMKSIPIWNEVGDKEDIARLYNNIGYIYLNQLNYSKAIESFKISLKNYEEKQMPDGSIGDLFGIALSYHNIGAVFNKQKNITRALKHFNRSLEIRIKIGDKTGSIESLNAIAYIFKDQGNIVKSIENYNLSLKFSEEINDKSKMATSFNNLATIYKDQGDIIKALEYYNNALKIYESLYKENEFPENKVRIAVCLNNIGFTYQNHGDPYCKSSKEICIKLSYKKALLHFEKSLLIYQELNNKRGIAVILNNIGSLYYFHGDPNCNGSKDACTKKSIETACQFYNQSIKLSEEINDKDALSKSYTNYGWGYYQQKKYENALQYGQKSMKVSLETANPEFISGSARLLSSIHKELNNHKLALENYELHIKMQDSINNESTRKASMKSQLKYEYEKQAAADSVAHAKESEIKNAEIAKQTAEIKAKKNQQYALFGGLALVVVFAGFMYNRFKITQKQKVIIEQQKAIVEEQKHLVEEKQTEILDSIRYAQRIQKAHLPSHKKIENAFKRIKK